MRTNLLLFLAANEDKSSADWRKSVGVDTDANSETTPKFLGVVVARRQDRAIGSYEKSFQSHCAVARLQTSYPAWFRFDLYLDRPGFTINHIGLRALSCLDSGGLGRVSE